jgi:hypothetical protein
MGLISDTSSGSVRVYIKECELLLRGDEDFLLRVCTNSSVNCWLHELAKGPVLHPELHPWTVSLFAVRAVAKVSTMVLWSDSMCQKKVHREDSCERLSHSYLARGFEGVNRISVPGFMVVGLGFSARRSAGWIWSSYLHPSQQPIGVDQVIPRRTRCSVTPAYATGCPYSSFLTSWSPSRFDLPL